jgi:FkbH-like protein
LVRAEDFVRDQPDGHAAGTTLSRIGGEIADALSAFLARSTTPMIVGVLPVSPAVTSERRGHVERAALELAERIRSLAGVQLLAPEKFVRLYAADTYDGIRDHYAHIPYSEMGYAELALTLARTAHVLKVLPSKVLVLDCDNTLWRGVVGEEGVEGIEISGGFRALQSYAVDLEARGTLICLASKNAQEDVLSVLERREDMVLKAGHIASHRINWLPKPANLRSMAAELNLGLDSFVFIDDNPVECAQMRAELPMVVTIQLPDEDRIPALIDNLWTFDKLVATEEDRNRTRMYRENAARRSLETAASDMGEFLSALELKIGIDVPSEDEWPRVSQLTQRTNQFNFTTQRRSESQLRAAVAAGGDVLRVRVSDRFGDYGLVGVLQAHTEGDSLVLDNMLLSCRVLGRGVEHAMFRHLGGIAAERGLSRVRLTLVTTPRNEPARAFLDSVVAQYAQSNEGGASYPVPAEVIRSIEHRPGEDPEEVIAASRADDRKTQERPAEDSGSAGRSSRYAALAGEFATAAGIVQKLHEPKSVVGRLPLEAVLPNSPSERQMLDIWERVLGISGFGMDYDYFALGGTSLQSVQLFAEITRSFGVELRLTSILEATTARKLLVLVEAQRAGHARDGLVRLRDGATRNLFLIHDGLGETLLYRNLAMSLPAGIAVYGVEPTRKEGIPLASATMEDLAKHYVSLIRGVQQVGPYYLGGMCAGGTIAYAMAYHLTAELGETVRLVAILDGAAPAAVPRGGVRLSRLRDTISQQSHTSRPLFYRVFGLAATIVRKALNLLAYESRLAIQKLSWKRRTAVLRRVLAAGAPWPRDVPPLTVAEIYEYLESCYDPPALPDTRVLLIRATEGQDGDRPFREVYREADLGWGGLSGDLETADVEGGHSSMLQDQHVHALVKVFSEKLLPAE